MTAYDKDFNNTLAIWTALNGNTTFGDGWIKLFSPEFAFTDSLTTNVVFHNTGDAIIIDGRAPKASVINDTAAYYDVAQKKFIRVDISALHRLDPYVHFDGDVELPYFFQISPSNGVYMLFEHGYNRDFCGLHCTRDGINWFTTATYGDTFSGRPDCAATDGTRAILSACSEGEVFYTDDLENGSWTSVARAGYPNYDVNLPIAELALFFKGRFVLYGRYTERAGGGYGFSESYDGRNWSRVGFVTHNTDTCLEHIFSFTEVNGKLFCCITRSYINDGKYTHIKHIALIADDLSGYTLTNVPSDLVYAERRTECIVYVDSLQKYLLFGDNVIFYSSDGLFWQAEPQTGFEGQKHGAIYIPGDGFYVNREDRVNGREITYYGKYP